MKKKRVILPVVVVVAILLLACSVCGDIGQIRSGIEEIAEEATALATMLPDEEAVEGRSVAGQLIDIGRAEVLVAVNAQVAPALIVGQDDQDVGLFGRPGRGGSGQKKEGAGGKRFADRRDDGHGWAFR